MDALKSKGQMLDQINLEQIPRSGFDLSYSTKGSGKIGRIIPTRCMETLPSDSIKGSTQAALQFQPLAVPILANMRVRQETWYVPNHILLDNWDTFITKGQDLSDNSVLPSFSLSEFLGQSSSLCRTLFGVDSVVSGKSPKLYVQPYATNDFSAEKGIQYANMFYDVTEFLNYWQSVLDYTYKGNAYVVPFGMDDLFDYRIQILGYYLTAFRSRIASLPECYIQENGAVRHFRGIPVFASKSSDYRGGSYEFSSYKQYPQVFDQLDTQLVGALSEPQYIYKVFSDEMKIYLQLLEDLYSPVVGVGSMFDYLGYDVLTPVDFRYLYLHKFCEFYDDSADSVGEGNLPVVASLDLFSYIPYELVSSSSQSVLPLRACYAIWYNNYRDKLLETAAPEPVTKSVVSSDELFFLSMLRIRAWSKDSFNTALANTGTGNMVVPISQQLSGARKEYDFAAKSTESMLDLGMTQYTLLDGSTIDMPTRYLSNNHTETTFTNQLKYEFSLDTLRRAGRTEKWIQKALIYGNLIQDALFTHWGVKIKNERIQLPEFVTSSSELVKIDTILNNTTTAESMAGDKAGFASAYDNGVSFDWYSPENGYLISFMTVLPEQTYAYGKPRHLCKLRIFDYAFPEFAQIGMDAVYNEEIKLAGVEDLKSYAKGIFGYQGRYYDYKCKQDEEHGQLRTTEDMYTFSRDFNIYDPNSRPKLNYRFVHCHPSLDMFVMDDPSQDQFRYDIHHSVAASRALPVCGMSV